MPFLRYEFPRVQSLFGRATAEHHARELARRMLLVPARDRMPALRWDCAPGLRRLSLGAFRGT